MGKMNSVRRSLIAVAFSIALTPASGAFADPISVPGGPTQLPTSGLIIDLPTASDFSYKLSGSWALDAAGDGFDTRDVVDEFDSATGRLVSGNWILMGYFNAGGCESVLAEMNFASPVITTETVWGETWRVLNGVFEFDNDLGRRPAAALCRENSLGQALLLERFLVNQSETLPYTALMTDVRASEVLANVSRAYSANRHGDIKPLRRPEVKARGEGTAARTVHLPKAGLDVALPDDGYLWLPYSDDDMETDMLNRLLPTLPEVSVEVMSIDSFTCPDLIASFDDPAMQDVRPTGLPDNWVPAPGVVVDGEVELIACHPTQYGVLLAGIFNGTDSRDVASLAPLLSAFAEAAEAR